MHDKNAAWHQVVSDGWASGYFVILCAMHCQYEQEHAVM